MLELFLNFSVALNDFAGFRVIGHLPGEVLDLVLHLAQVSEDIQTLIPNRACGLEILRLR